ncbi:MAG TPA: hypothetical protein VGF22_05765 [Acidimicrobiales bacterium]|jgi:amino acid transporter
MNNKPTVPQIIIMAAGAVMLLGSFLDFYGDTSAWGDGAFAIITLAALLGVVMAVVVALTAFANVKLPETVLGFTWKQIHLLLAVYAVVLMIGWLIYKVPGSKDFGAGFWLMFLGAIGLVVGAVMLQRDETAAAAGPGTGTTPPTPF